MIPNRKTCLPNGPPQQPGHPLHHPRTVAPDAALSTATDTPASSKLTAQIQSIIVEQFQQMMLSSSPSSPTSSSTASPAIAPFSPGGNIVVIRSLTLVPLVL